MFRKKMHLKGKKKENKETVKIYCKADYRKIVLDRTGNVPVEFEGVQVANVSSNLRGKKNRWTELKVFKTRYGKYVVQILGITTMEGEFERSTVKPADELDEIPNILGLGALAKAIYKQLSIVLGNDRL